MYFLRNTIMQSCKSNKPIDYQGLWCYTWAWGFSQVHNYIFPTSSHTPFFLLLLYFTACTTDFFSPLYFLFIPFCSPFSAFKEPAIPSQNLAASYLPSLNVTECDGFVFIGPRTTLCSLFYLVACDCGFPKCKVSMCPSITNVICSACFWSRAWGKDPPDRPAECDTTKVCVALGILWVLAPPVVLLLVRHQLSWQ